MRGLSVTMGKTRRKPWLLVAMIVSFCLFSCNANFVYADSDNLNLGVTTTINAKCKFMTDGPSGSTLEFGQYNVISENEISARNSTGSFDAKCTKSTSSEIGMGSGLYAGNASATTRAMSDGMGNYLSYEIYTDAGGVSVWSESNTVSFTDVGDSYTTMPVYASIPPGQDVAAGEYSDTVVMTISY